jgi:glyoxylate reductase
LTRSDFKLTKRGTDNPLVPAAGGDAPCADRPVAESTESKTASAPATAHQHAVAGVDLQVGSLMSCPNHDLAIEIKPVPGSDWQGPSKPATVAAVSSVLSSWWPSVKQGGILFAGLPASPYRARAAMPTSKKPIVIVTRKLPEAVETRMRELFDARLNVGDNPMSPAELSAAVKAAHVLVPTVTDRIDRSLLSQAGPQLKLIANFGNGVDNIDLDTARVRGIIVTNTPGVLTEDTADMTMALILAVPRRLAEGTALLKDGKQHWSGWSPTWMLGHRIWGKRLGIIGMGRIGQAVARRARAFGLQIHYYNRRRVSEEIEQELEATHWESLDQMLARMDIVSVNCPHTPATYHLLSARRLKLLKPTAYIVNTARGEVIDENELARMVEAGQIAGAGLDVFENEPAVNPKLLASERVVALPHMGSATIEGRIDMGEKVIINIKTFLDGHNPPDRVHAAMF